MKIINYFFIISCQLLFFIQTSGLLFSRIIENNYNVEKFKTELESKKKGINEFDPKNQTESNVTLNVTLQEKSNYEKLNDEHSGKEEINHRLENLKLKDKQINAAIKLIEIKRLIGNLDSKIATAKSNIEIASKKILSIQNIPTSVHQKLESATKNIEESEVFFKKMKEEINKIIY